MSPPDMAHEARNPKPRNAVLIVQGLYYIVTGIWSLVDVKSFQKVTGPKVDVWLVKTVGVLVLASGAVMLFAGLRRQRSIETVLLAAGSAVGLIAINVYYVSVGRISRVYLGDAVAEALFLLALIVRRR